jgi:hypothetical protein
VLSDNLAQNKDQIRKVIRQLSFVQKQLDEIKIGPDRAYLDNLGEQLYKLELSLVGDLKLRLDEVTSGANELVRDQIKTPYDAKIEEVKQFFSYDLRESDLANRAIKTVVENNTKREIINYYIEQQTIMDVRQQTLEQ